jgi:hypothetical protein
VVEHLRLFMLCERALGEGGEQVGVGMLAGHRLGAQALPDDLGHINHHSLPFL